MNMQENIEHWLKEVQMGLFGLIFSQDGSHQLWEASGMPAGPKTGKKSKKKIKVCGLRGPGPLVACGQNI